MLKKFTQPKYLLILVAGIILISSLAWFAVRVNRLQERSGESGKLVSFDYCAEELTKLCVVSFGRDADGNTIVNLFVPEDEFPIFYLKVTRATGESVYECDKNDEVKTSVYCTGDPLNLEERFDIQIVSVKDDQILAQGRFTLTAFLITGPTADVQTPQTTPEVASSTQTESTPTVSSGTSVASGDLATEVPEETVGVDTSVASGDLATATATQSNNDLATPTTSVAVNQTATSVAVIRATPTATSDSYPSYP